MNEDCFRHDIKMECQKITNLLGNLSDKVPRFITLYYSLYCSLLLALNITLTFFSVSSGVCEQVFFRLNMTTIIAAKITICINATVIMTITVTMTITMS